MFYVVTSLNLMFSLIKHFKIWRHLEWQEQKNLPPNSKHPPLCSSLESMWRAFLLLHLLREGERKLQMQI